MNQSGCITLREKALSYETLYSIYNYGGKLRLTDICYDTAIEILRALHALTERNCT